MRQVVCDLIAWNAKYGHLTSPAPMVPDMETIALRFRLIEEEYEELTEAMDEHDLPAIAKEGIDLIFVTVGTLLAYGIDPEAAWRAVVESNMSKGVEKDAGGKSIKGPDYRPADMARVIAEQGPFPSAGVPAASDGEAQP